MAAGRCALLIRGLVAGLFALCLAGAAAASATEPYPVPWTIGAGVAAQLREPDAPPPGANDWSCRPSAAHPDPVVLVHGLSANRTVNWQTFSPLLANHGYCVFALTYGTRDDVQVPGYQPGGLARMQDSALELRRFVHRVIDATGAARVDIVGHSEGSLMPDWYVRFLGGARVVHRYIGMTPLWDGTDVAGLATLDQIVRALLGSSLPIPVIDSQCASCRQFLHGSDFLRELNDGGAADPRVRYTMIMTRDDELVVPYTSGFLDGARVTNIVVQDQCSLDHAEHLAIAADPIAARDVLNALDPAHAKPPPCVPVLPFIGAPGFG